MNSKKLIPLDLPNNSRLIIVIAAPSGTGKTTVIHKLRESYLPNLGFSVSCTTRSPRAGEVNGKDYYFLSREEFEKRISAGDFLEYAVYAGHFYGTLLSEIQTHLQANRDLILDIEIQGVQQILKKINDCPSLQRQRWVFVFLMPPSWEELERRLISRGSENMEKIEERLKIAKKEVEMSHLFDITIVNDNLDEAVQKLSNYIELRRIQWINRNGDFKI